MKATISVLIWCLMTACNSQNERPPASPPPGKMTIDEMGGKRIDVLIERFGLPDYIGPREHFQVKAASVVDATVVFRYKKLGREIFILDDSTIALVTYTKEFLMDPKNAQFIKERDKENEAVEEAPAIPAQNSDH